MRQYFTQGQLPVQANIPGAPDKKVTGKMTFLDNAITSGTGTISLRATMPNKDAVLWPGLFVDVELILTTLQNAIVVPSQCVMVGQQGPYVFVVNSDNMVTRHQVEIGQRHADSTVISKGVNAGDHVVTAGQLGLQDGMKVSATPFQAPPALPGRVPSPSPTPGKAK